MRSRVIVALLMTMFSFAPVAARAATGAAPAHPHSPARDTAPATLIVSTFDGEAHLYFDQALISEEYLGRVAVLGPYLASPRPVAEGFVGPDLAGVETDLGDVVSLLGDLAGLSVPSELDAVLAYVRRETAFYLCLRSAALAYYRGDDSALSVVCEEVDAADACMDFVIRAPLMRTPEARYRLADYGWQACMHARFEAIIGLYPLENWQMFLRNHGIQEELVESHGC